MQKTPAYLKCTQTENDMNIQVIKNSEKDFRQKCRSVINLLRQGGLTSGPTAINIPTIVADIIARVASRGDDALIEYEKQLDRVTLTSQALRVPGDKIASVHRQAQPEFLSLMRRAIKNIREYQQHIKISAPAPLRRGGRSLGVRYTPIERVGLYVPGGKALYPSTVLMTAVPAQVAGVKEIVMVSPPNTDGDINPMVLALAGELGITEVYRLGGAQAIAALALGTQTIKPVQKIVGPGNAFVAEAKRKLFGKVAIDSVAGPSEVLILADETADAKCIAADMMAQAEHDPGSAILITTSEPLCKTVIDELASQIKLLSRSDAIAASLEKYSAVILAADIDSACELANDFAAEHLQIITADSHATLKKIRNAGAIFLGHYTPVPVGDYYAGPSHVLPTGGGAKCFSPLSVNDFLKSSSIIEYDKKSLDEDKADIFDFASREGLTAHAKSPMKRFEK